MLDVPSPVRPERCPVEDWLAFMGHRWNALVLWHLQDAPLRHRELMARLPRITPKVLGQRLRALRSRGLLARGHEGAGHDALTYALTPRGRALLAVLDQLELWARADRAAAPQPPA